MLRDKSLIPLSRHHQHALALCVRIERALPIPDVDLPAWQAEIVQQVESEIRVHFRAEEKVLFPLARKFDELTLPIDNLTSEHSVLRDYFDSAEKATMSAQDLSAFAQLLSSHIRKEERQLFQRLQELMTQEQLASLGEQLEIALEGASQICALTERKAQPQN